MQQNRNNLKIVIIKKPIILRLSHFNTHLPLQCGKVSVRQFAFSVSQPASTLPNFSHYSCGTRSYKFTFTRDFVMHPHHSTEPRGSEESPWEGRASPLRPVCSNEAVASRTLHSSAEHTEHDQHFEQATAFHCFKRTFRVCSG